MKLQSLFAADPQRGQTFQQQAVGLLFDYSKNHIDAATIPLLAALARARGLETRIAAMFAGELVNPSEQRAALHFALRAPPGEACRTGGVDISPEVHRVLDHMADFSVQVREGQWRGHTGEAIRTVVNIGIGGSDLGPAMAVQALRFYATDVIDIRFVANVDPEALAAALRGLRPAETLFIVCSKSFRTQETLSNATAAVDWLLAELLDAEAVARHFVAVSANAAGVAAFGIPEANLFPIWDWVGGRYSLPSAIGLSVMIAVGPAHFRDMLHGMHTVDRHFQESPLERNLPVLMGLLSIWNNNFLGAGTQAILPYAEALGRLPAYLQQLSMESNGKQMDERGQAVEVTTSPIVWGYAGTPGQHSFFQLLHQGTHRVACDFIGFCQSNDPDAQRHDILMAHLFAQAEARAFGAPSGAGAGTTGGVAAATGAATTNASGTGTDNAARRGQQRFDGDRPSSVLLAQSLTPETLGSLVALYEHSVFTQAAIWDVDCFDQWGVELGKTLARRILPELVSPAEPELAHDSSTNHLILHYRSHQRASD